MTIAERGRRFLESTRGQIIRLLRRRTHTVDELAQGVGLTDNAVRSHLAVLERDGLVRQEGVRRGPGAGKPAVLYDLEPEAEELLSRAYPPVLTAVLDVMVDRLPADQAAELLREVGHRLAQSLGGTATGALDQRLHAAAAVLTALGGDVEVVHEGGEARLKGWGCPLSVAVSRRPELCGAVESLVAEVTGTEVRQCCEHEGRPRCCFAAGTAA